MTKDSPSSEEPFGIATLPVADGGRLGLCPLPGGAGALETDIETIAAWRPDLVVTLTESSEMQAGGVARLAAAFAAREIDWCHFPIRDYHGPDGDRKTLWPQLAARIHSLLDADGSVLVHCRGGKGRSGMILLRILMERGEPEADALARLRRTRPGAVETDGQLAWAVQGTRPPG